MIVDIVNWTSVYERLQKELKRNPSGKELSEQLETELIRNFQYQIKCVQDKKFTLLDQGLIRIDT